MKKVLNIFLYIISFLLLIYICRYVYICKVGVDTVYKPEKGWRIEKVIEAMEDKKGYYFDHYYEKDVSYILLSNDNNIKIEKVLNRDLIYKNKLKNNLVFEFKFKGFKFKQESVLEDVGYQYELFYLDKDYLLIKISYGNKVLYYNVDLSNKRAFKIPFKPSKTFEFDCLWNLFTDIIPNYNNSVLISPNGFDIYSFDYKNNTLDYICKKSNTIATFYLPSGKKCIIVRDNPMYNTICEIKGNNNIVPVYMLSWRSLYGSIKVCGNDILFLTNEPEITLNAKYASSRHNLSVDGYKTTNKFFIKIINTDLWQSDIFYKIKLNDYTRINEQNLPDDKYYFNSDNYNIPLLYMPRCNINENFISDIYSDSSYHYLYLVEDKKTNERYIKRMFTMRFVELFNLFFW